MNKHSVMLQTCSTAINLL